MKTTSTMQGTYGIGRACDVFTYAERGGTWYAVDGSTVANFTRSPLNEGVNVEELPDEDTLTWNEPIRSEEDLATAVEDDGPPGELDANGNEWIDIDLSRAHEQDRRILEPYTFATLLLEIRCNISNITPEAIRAQFESELQAKMRCAREVFEANAESIYRQALAERAIP